MLPEGSRSPERISQILEERGIGFLIPSLRLNSELEPLIFSIVNSEEETSSDNLLHDRLTEKFPPDERVSEEFLRCLFHLVIGEVYKRGSCSGGGSAANCMKFEKDAWIKVKNGLLPSLEDDLNNQMLMLHQLQVFWEEKGRPKGFLLRCFVNLYQINLVDEDTFLYWKEEVNPSFPAKGQALFEVNKWMTWLETAESEDEEQEN